MAHFYLVDELAAEGDVVELTGPEAKHAATVSRARVGESLSLGDGRGAVAAGVVESVSPQSLAVRLSEVVLHDAPDTTITLVQALAKGDRDELAIQAATELGVDRIVPWQAERSVSRWEGAKATRGVERWTTIVREAVKQSIRPRIPVVTELASMADVVALAASSRVLVLHPDAETSLADSVAGTDDIVLVVGPEGGITPSELARFTAAGAVPVRLGAEVLRTSTAGPAAIAALSILTGRWS